MPSTLVPKSPDPWKLRSNRTYMAETAKSANSRLREIALLPGIVVSGGPIVSVFEPRAFLVTNTKAVSVDE